MVSRAAGRDDWRRMFMVFTTGKQTWQPESLRDPATQRSWTRSSKPLGVGGWLCRLSMEFAAKLPGRPFVRV